MLHLGLEHDPQRRLLQVRQLRQYERLRIDRDSLRLVRDQGPGADENLVTWSSSDLVIGLGH